MVLNAFVEREVGYHSLICRRQYCHGFEHGLWSQIILGLNFASFIIVGKLSNLSEFVSLIIKCGGY